MAGFWEEMNNFGSVWFGFPKNGVYLSRLFSYFSGRVGIGKKFIAINR